MKCIYQRTETSIILNSEILAIFSKNQFGKDAHYTSLFNMVVKVLTAPTSSVSSSVNWVSTPHLPKLAETESVCQVEHFMWPEYVFKRGS